MTIPFTTEATERIKIKILDTNNKRIVLKAKKTTKIRTLKKACAKRMDKCLDSFKLTYKGKVLNENETLQSLNMIDKNNIMIKMRPVQALEHHLEQGVLVPNGHNSFVYQWPETETLNFLANPITPILDQNENRLPNALESLWTNLNMDIDEDMDNMPEDIQRSIMLFEDFDDFIK